MPHDLVQVSPVPQRGTNTGVTKDLEGRDSTNSRHMILIDQMIAWSIANPGKPWSQCAVALGLSTLWVRTVASTDAFRARYSQIKDDLIQECGLSTLKDKINAAAEIGVERLAAKLEVAESMSDITDATEMLLGQVYGSGKTPAPSQTITVNQAVILEGRDAIVNRVSEAPAALEVKSGD
jgi:hypothetical protein